MGRVELSVGRLAGFGSRAYSHKKLPPKISLSLAVTKYPLIAKFTFVDFTLMIRIV